MQCDALAPHGRPLLVLTRTGETFIDGRKVRGERVKIRVGARTWPESPAPYEAIENADIERRLPAGPYEGEFGYITFKSGKRAKAIRILGEFSRNGTERGRYYIHVANYPYQLDGCFSPGVRRTKRGVAESQVAQDAIHRALGGWERGAKVGLLIE